MLKRILTLLFCCIATFAIANPYGGRQSRSCSKFYLGLSTGIDNQSGIIGVNFDVPVTGRFSLGTGLGLSLWGYKTYGEGRFYFKDCNRGWALGAGVTHSTGFDNIISELPTTIGTTDVSMNLNPTTNVIFSGYHFFNLGRGNHRFYLQLGWSHRITESPYTITSGHKLDADGEAGMNILAPGGVILGFGFSFGLGGR